MAPAVAAIPERLPVDAFNPPTVVAFAADVAADADDAGRIVAPFTVAPPQWIAAIIETQQQGISTRHCCLQCSSLATVDVIAEVADHDMMAPLHLHAPRMCAIAFGVDAMNMMLAQGWDAGAAKYGDVRLVSWLGSVCFDHTGEAADNQFFHGYFGSGIVYIDTDEIASGIVVEDYTLGDLATFSARALGQVDV